MAVAAGLYGLTFEKMFIDTMAQTLEAETHKAFLTQNAETPDFNLDDFRDDANASEASGANYTAGGQTITVTEVTVAAGFVKWDFDNPSWAASSITARGLVPYFNVGTAATDAVIGMNDFGSDFTSTNGTFTVQLDANGFFRIDITV